jgi:hypothetical protein
VVKEHFLPTLGQIKFYQRKLGKTIKMMASGLMGFSQLPIDMSEAFRSNQVYILE